MIKLEHTVLASPEQMEKDIPNHQGFKARTDGTIIGKRGRPMKGHVDRCGYREVLLSENGKTNNARVHRLMAETFIPNPYNLRDVNHKDGNKLDNNVNNLEWCSTLDNLNHSHVIEKASVAKFRKVKCVTTGKIYNSIKEAADELGLYHSNIVACCNGRRATCGGLEWEYI